MLYLRKTSRMIHITEKELFETPQYFYLEYNNKQNATHINFAIEGKPSYTNNWQCLEKFWGTWDQAERRLEKLVKNL